MSWRVPEQAVHPVQQGLRQADRLCRRLRRAAPLRRQRVCPGSRQWLRPPLHRHQGVLQMRV